MEARITASTPFEQLPVWLTLKEVAIYTGRNYNALLNSLKAGKCFVSAKRNGGRWAVNKEQLAEPKIERRFRK